MTTFVYTSHTGDVSTVDAEPGESAMHAATQNGVVGITGECGGVLSCATCHVFVDDGDLTVLGPASEQEEEMLEGTAVDREESSRLSCQIRAAEGLDQIRMTLPEYQE
jgi:2Fe-2S ferredoxin